MIVPFIQAGIGADSGFWTPAELGSALDAWHDASDRSTQTPTTGVGVLISQWRDKSGNGNDLNQTTGSEQPISGSLSLSGLNVIDFSEIKNMDYDLAWASGSITPFQLVNSDAADELQTIYAQGPTGASTFIPFSEKNGVLTTSVRVNGANIESAVLDVYSSGSLMPIVDRNDMYNALVDGTYIVSSIGGIISSPAPLSMGRVTQPFTLNGSISESIIVSGVVSTDDRQKIEGYLSWKWDGQVSGTLVGKLPIGHPYKLAPPKV